MARNGKTPAEAIQLATAEINNHTDLIGQIRAALSGKVGGGSTPDYETVLLTVNNSSGQNLSFLSCTAIIDGELVHLCESENLEQYISLNLVKNTAYFAKAGTGIGITMTNDTTNFITGSGVAGGIALADIVLTTAAPCFVQGTKILMADYTLRNVEDVIYDDNLLVWDFDNGCYASAKPIWIKKTQQINGYYHCKFENGIELKLVGSDGNCHRVFSLDDNRFEYATSCVGKLIYTEKGITKLLSCEYIEEPVYFYNIITENHLNLFAETVLTSCRLNNMYLIKDMKFVKDNRDIIPISAYPGVNESFYDGLRLGEQGVENIEATNEYIHRLYILMKSSD